MPDKKKLYRSQEDRLFFGVCSGLAKYFNMDPLIMRLIFVVLGLIQGLGIVIYLIMFIAVPKEPGDYVEVDRKEKVKEFVKNVEQKAESVASEVRQEAKSVKDEFKKEEEDPEKPDESENNN